MTVEPDLSAYDGDNDPVPCVVDVLRLRNAEYAPGQAYGATFLYMIVGPITYRLKEFIRNHTSLGFVYSAIYTPGDENSRRMAWTTQNNALEIDDFFNSWGVATRHAEVDLANLD